MKSSFDLAAQGELQEIWLTIGVHPPSFNQAPVAHWKNGKLICI